MTKQQLVLQNIDLAKKIAKSKKSKSYRVNYDEILSAAYFGLVLAAENYNHKLNDNFRNYAATRIFGAIGDYFREISWFPRSENKTMCNTSVEFLAA